MVDPQAHGAESEIYTSTKDGDAAEDYTSLKRSILRTHGAGDHADSIGHALDQRLPPETKMQISIPASPTATELALAALQYLPTPVIVLSSWKTIVLANEAMGRLLGIRGPGSQDTVPQQPVSEILRGQSLSQVGVDLISDGVPVWVSWERFLDKLAAGMTAGGEQHGARPGLPNIGGGETTPTTNGQIKSDVQSEPRKATDESHAIDPTVVHDTVVEVVVSTMHGHYSPPSSGGERNHRSARSPGQHVACRMIISVWQLEGEQYFTVTFTSSSPASNQAHARAHVVPRTTPSSSTRHHPSSHTPTSRRSSSSRGSSAGSSAVTSPAEVSLSTSSFPPAAAPSKVVSPPAYTDFQKITRMKDAMLAAMDIPVLAMYKDESVVIPNNAMRKLLSVDADPLSEDSYDFMSRFRPWTPDFQRELAEEENPIITLIRTELGFSRWQIGIDQGGKRAVYDVEGQPVHDEKTGEFFAGLVVFKDVTDYTEKIATQTAENEQQFSLICDTMPQMIWTTRPDGYHDYFSQRWYDYTGLTPQNSLGLGWKLPFHEDEMAETVKRWQHSLKTGEEYITEYRCRKWDGEWRWMLGRALPLRDTKSGKILKWFGTCTDIQDVVDARIAGRRLREQLSSVLKHAEMTMWTTDKDANITFFEGEIVPGLVDQPTSSVLGRCIYAVLSEVDHGGKSVQRLKTAVDRILKGESTMEVFENTIAETKRSYRSRIIPQYAQKGSEGMIDENTIEGAIGISMDVTKLKEQESENIRLLAQEHTARESSKMKSSFLANMSHEIRTPIAGVLGMSELLIDTKLDEEQSDFAHNIHRSATSLLTVINDILDLSKIESGKLLIEEVQFSIGTVLGDVSKMLAFAADKKNLQFISDISLGRGAADDLVVIGDPGRVRQILTNLLTNSIKFTSTGFVKLMVRVVEETESTATVKFCVEDTGIGIEEEVKKRLFRPFTQADGSTARRFGGTGLGLTISKNLVDLMHGTIELESKLDTGTTAHFQIPFTKPEYASGSPFPTAEVGFMPDRLHSELSMSADASSHGGSRTPGASPAPRSPRAAARVLPHKPPGEAAPPGPAATTDVQRQKFHVLVVEDNVVNSMFAAKTLRTLGFSASIVWNGREALDYLLKAVQHADSDSRETNPFPIPSLILMDVQMPVLDGYRATHTIRKHEPFRSHEVIQKIPIVAMTASAIQGDKEKCERAGMDDYLAKPVKRATLEETLVQWVLGRKKTKVVSDNLENGTNSCSGRPDLSRNETDHSSNCPGPDEVFGSPVPLKALSASTSTTRRSSLSRTRLAAEMPGTESEAERGMRRRVDAEEQASSLRDAKLLNATADSDSHQLPVVGDVNFRFTGAEQSGTTLLAEAGQEQALPALTEENVEKLNADHSDPIPHIRQPSDTDDVQDLGAHGSPLHHLPATDHLTSSPAVADSAPSEVDESSSVIIPGQSGRTLLGAMQRWSSDWSTTTVKPPRPEQ